MQRLLAAVCSTALLVTTTSAADKAQTKPANPKPAAGNRNASANRAADEKKLRQAAADFASAYNEGDAKAIAAQFAPEAEMVDLDGKITQGREAIEKAFAEHLAEPEFKVAVEIESLRFVGDNIAVEDGHLIFTDEEHDTTLRSRYTVVHQRDGGEWQIVSSRDVVNPHDRVAPHEHLKRLAWLVGDWVEERGDSIITTNCRWDESKNYLLSDYTVKIAGQPSISGTQRIGWDPLTKQIKTWTFDNDGSYGEGFWHRDGDRWLVKLTGVAADGRSGSTTQIHAQVNDHSRTWSSIDRLLGGESLPDIKEVTVVRAAPKPKQAAAKKAAPPTKGKSN